MVSQDAFDTAVHAKSGAFAVTVKLPVPPEAGTLTWDGLIVTEPIIPVCVTVKVWPAIVRVPVRVAVSGFAATEKSTVPLPVPLAPDVTVSHEGELLTAVQLQVEAEALTPTLPVPPAAVADMPLEPIRNEQVVLVCVNVTVWPAIVMVAERMAPLFAVADHATVPEPVPEAPDVMVSQDAFGTAVQPKSGAFAVTVKLPVPPAAGTLTWAGLSVTEPTIPVCVTVNVWPATVMVPIRVAVSGFAAMLK
jgi:hypothetical protein